MFGCGRSLAVIVPLLLMMLLQLLLVLKVTRKRFRRALPLIFGHVRDGLWMLKMLRWRFACLLNAGAFVWNKGERALQTTSKQARAAEAQTDAIDLRPCTAASRVQTPTYLMLQTTPSARSVNEASPKRHRSVSDQLQGCPQLAGSHTHHASDYFLSLGENTDEKEFKRA